MKKKVILGFFVVCFSFSNLMSQDLNKYFTIYSNGFVQPVYHNYLDNFYRVVAFSPSFAYHKELRRFIVQYEVMPFLMFSTQKLETQSNGGSQIISGGFEQRTYESWIALNFKFIILKSDIGQINARLDNMLYFNYSSYKPFVSSSFDYFEKNIGWRINIGLEFEKTVSEKISFSFIPMVTANNLYNRISRYKNPAIPVREQSETDFSNSAFPNQYYLKIGLKYLL